MAEINIGVTVPIGDDVNPENVYKLMKAFAKKGKAIGANTAEVAAAISTMQDDFFELFGAIPISVPTIEMIRSAHMYKAEEDK